MSYISPRDWHTALEELTLSAPFNFSVLDDFLANGADVELRDQLLSMPGWKSREIPHQNGELKWVAKQTLIRNPSCPLLSDILGEIHASLICRSSNPALSVSDCWAIAWQSNEGIFPHCDGGRLSLNLWLTPESNFDSAELGGIIFFDVKRAPSMPDAAFRSERGGSTEFVNQHATSVARVPYRCNRATLFDAWTFHATDIFKCREGNETQSRLNLTFTFDVHEA